MSNFRWNKPNKWFKLTSNLIVDIWGNDFISYLKDNDIKPNLFDLGWLKDYQNKSHLYQLSKSPVDQFSLGLRDLWSKLTVFHACRTKNVATYYSKGIVAPSLKELDLLVIQVLKDEVTTKVRNDLIKLLHNYYDKSDEKVFVAIDRYNLQFYSNHYLEFGSEYLLTAIMLLNRFGINIEPVLNSVRSEKDTIPTIFECEIPIQKISKQDLKELSLILLIETCNKIIDSRYIFPSRRTGICAGSIIDGKMIIGHAHPEIDIYKKILPSTWMPY